MDSSPVNQQFLHSGFSGVADSVVGCSNRLWGIVEERCCQRALALWAAYTKNIERRIVSCYPLNMYARAQRLSCLAFCVPPELSFGDKIVQVAQSIFREEDNNIFWRSTVQGKIAASLERFLNVAASNPSVKSICDQHIAWLNARAVHEDREENVLLLKAVQGENFRAAALLEAVLNGASYIWEAMPEDIVSSYSTHIHHINEQLKRLQSEQITRKAYEECCRLVERLSLDFQYVATAIYQLFVQELEKIDMKQIWKERQVLLTHEVSELLFGALGKEKDFEDNKVLVKEKVFKVRVIRQVSPDKVALVVKTRVFRNNKSVHHYLDLSLQQGQNLVVKEWARIMFPKFITQEARWKEVINWRNLLQLDSNILPMRPIVEEVEGNQSILGVDAPWCREGTLFDIASNPTALAAWPVEKRIRCLIQVVRILAKLHACGGVDLDVKGSNILRKGEDGVWRIDFGSIHRVGKGVFTGSRTTRQYTSPEQFSSAWIPYQPIDMWAFALVMVEVFHGLKANSYLYSDWLEEFSDDPSCPKSVKVILNKIEDMPNHLCHWPEECFCNPQYFEGMNILWGMIRNRLLKGLDSSLPTTALIARLLSTLPEERPTAGQTMQALEQILANLTPGLYNT